MKIYTKTGDEGTTMLFGGARVLKSDLRIEAYGTVDELNSYVGLVRFRNIDPRHQKTLAEVQDRLFTLGSILASDPSKENIKVPDLHDADIELLETEIDHMTDYLPEMKHFILPGGNDTIGYCHVARCICRRAERLAVALNSESEVPAIVVKYLNRLSDYLFVLARAIGQDDGVEETPWKPRM